MNELQKELRLGNLVLDRGKPTILKPSQYIDWGFEFGFNKSVVEKQYWIGHKLLMENIIAGSSDFEIIFSEHKENPELNEIMYYVDNKLLEFGLDDTFHNLQNLFYISSGQELPINKQ